MRGGLYQLPAGLPLGGLLSLPDRPPHAEPAPLLLFLHGEDEGAPAPLREALLRHGPLHPGSASLARREFVVLAPQLPCQGDAWSAQAGKVEALVEFTQRHWGTDPDRVYLTGFSCGGNGVLDLALHTPSRWAALWAVEPTRVPRADPGIPVWLSLGDQARPSAAALAQALRLQHSGFGAGERVYHDDGLGPVETAAMAYGDAEIYAWLLRHRRGTVACAVPERHRSAAPDPRRDTLLRRAARRDSWSVRPDDGLA